MLSYSRDDQALLKTKLTTPYDMTNDFYFRHTLEREDGLYNLAKGDLDAGENLGSYPNGQVRIS